MKLPPARHRWKLTPTQAIRLQSRLAALVVEAPLRAPPRLVAGGDAAFSPDGREALAAWVVWDAQERSVLEEVVAVQPVRMPYIPGLLSFREAPALLAAARRLRTEPDAFILDGQGRAHPRRFGLACHVGIRLDRVTVGCGKSRLCGTADTPAAAAGASKPLLHNGEVIGRVVRTREGASPVFVSIGHRIDLMGAVRLVLRCCTHFRIPDPTRLADQVVTRHARTRWRRQAQRAAD
jgi:deoxyribonuclease V